MIIILFSVGLYQQYTKFHLLMITATIGAKIVLKQNLYKNAIYRL